MWVIVAMATTAHADPVPAKNQALLLLRILAYDHNLKTRVDSKTATIVIVFKGDADDVASELSGVIREIAKSTTLSGRAIQVARMSFNDKTFDADVAKLKASAIYITPGLSDSISSITATSQARKLLSFCGTADFVASGVSVGFVLADGKPQILVNVPASRKEGADLDVALLKAAKIVKK